MGVLVGESGPDGQAAAEESEILYAESHQGTEISPLPKCGQRMRQKNRVPREGTQSDRRGHSLRPRIEVDGLYTKP